MSEADRLFLVADIGGTHARFALARQNGGALQIEPPNIMPTAENARLDQALGIFLQSKGAPPLDGVAVCAAGPVDGAGDGASISMTNCPWEISVAALARATGVAHPVLMNDFAALALSIPHLGSNECHAVGGGDRDADCPIGVLGAGTGLGVASLVPDGRGAFIVLPGEGGHVDLAPANAREICVVAQLIEEFGHASVERVLSGPGIAALYLVLQRLAGRRDAVHLSAVEIAARARDGASPVAIEAVSLFCGWLGAVAGNLALTLGAKGGIYIGGGIVPGWIAERLKSGVQLFDERLFRERFEAKGRFASYLARIPVHVIMREDPALLGLAHAAISAEATSKSGDPISRRR